MREVYLKGVIIPMVTPFDAQGRLDEAATRQLTNYLIERGVHGLFPAGSTGEGPLLTADERRRLAEIVVQETAGRVPVIIHTGALTQAETIALTQHAQSIGAQGVAVVTPFYFRLKDEALFRFYAQVAASVPDFPIFLYNIPQLTGNNLSAELVARLVEHCPNIVGMKDSSGSLATLAASLPLRGGKFSAAIGADGLFLAAVAMGIGASVSGNANVVPELFVALYNAAFSGDFARARELQRQVDAVRRILEDGSDLSLFKGMLAKRGIPVGTVRPPLFQASEAVIEQRWQALNALNLKLMAVSPVGA
ncbi:MAG: dihydrodipicolinate synthase family protein [Anaerolineae bacterium]|nr:dihydrodipicolinate synthase family protein [Anaerolineae bacterium]